MTNELDIYDFLSRPYSDADDEAVTSVASLKVSSLCPATDQLGFDVTEDFVEQQRELLAHLNDSKLAVRPTAATSRERQRLVPGGTKADTDSTEFMLEKDSLGEQSRRESRCLIPNKRGLEMYFTESLQDEAFIQEQRRILEQIGNDSKANLDGCFDSPSNTQTRHEADQVTAFPDALRDGRNRSVVGYEHVTCLQRSDSGNGQPGASDEKDKYREVQDNAVSSTEDCVASLPNGKKILLKGTLHVYEAIVQGTSTLVKCFNCQALLQVPESTPAVYCTVCHEVTPMDLARSCINNSTSTGGTTTILADSEIAGTLQEQEINLDHVKKLARMMTRN